MIFSLPNWILLRKQEMPLRLRELGIKATSSNMKSSYNLHNKENATGEFILDTKATPMLSRTTKMENLGGLY